MHTHCGPGPLAPGDTRVAPSQGTVPDDSLSRPAGTAKSQCLQKLEVNVPLSRGCRRRKPGTASERSWRNELNPFRQNKLNPISKNKLNPRNPSAPDACGARSLLRRLALIAHCLLAQGHQFLGGGRVHRHGGVEV